MRLNPFYTYYYQWNSKIVQHKSTRPHQINIIHKKFNYKRYLFKRKKKEIIIFLFKRKKKEL